jgi:uncharacterized membrane protein YqjE
MRPEAPRSGEFKQEQESFGGLLSRLASASAGLFRDEVDLAKQEMREKVRSLKTGVIAIAIAVLLGMIALLTLDAALVVAMGRVIGFGVSALVVGSVVVIAAGILAGFGITRIKRTSLKPEKTIRSLKEDGEWLKRTVGDGWSAIGSAPPGDGRGMK